MEEMEYRKKMLGMKMAELSILTAINANLHAIAMAGGKQGVLPNWNEGKNAYDNGKALVDRLPPG